MDRSWLAISLIFGGMLLFSRLRGSNAGQIIEDIIDELPRTGDFPYRSPDVITSWVIHHSATSSGDPWAFANYHISHHGWAGIAYAFVIMEDGKIYQTNRIDRRSPHAGNGRNTDTLGICLVGDFSQQPPPAAQLEAAAWLIKYLNAQLGQKPILGHRDVNPARTCPGDSLDLDLIRNLVYQNIA
jgi:N-acetylmuramoyl-L-alanine amidase